MRIVTMTALVRPPMSGPRKVEVLKKPSLGSGEGGGTSGLMPIQPVENVIRKLAMPSTAAACHSWYCLKPRRSMICLSGMDGAASGIWSRRSAL